ncbi:hypothetical protein HYC85_029351 [Camellia sinensis]|uniref:Uncharacterized protein n=1 Tax=Camellia sinensis TaxID=4442 RepID=A0A7J7FXS3_CAMSI|nr:hypothetical protein HYC85_029351 [Camellia sinensis]
MVIQTHTHTAFGLHTELQQNESLVLSTHISSPLVRRHHHIFYCTKIPWGEHKAQ